MMAFFAYSRGHQDGERGKKYDTHLVGRKAMSGKTVDDSEGF